METSLLVQISQELHTFSGAEGLAVLTLAILGASLVYRDYYQTKTQSRYHNRLLNLLKANELTVDEILALEYVPREIITYLRESGTLSVKPQE